MSQSRDWIATARLLRRIGFGTTGPQVDAVVSRGWSAHLDEILDLDPDADPGAVATPMPKPITPPLPNPSSTSNDLEAFSREVAAQMRDLEFWWLRRMAAVEQPIHEKLTLLWHNHFATSADKVVAAEYMGAQNQKLRTLKLGDFRTLAYAMLTDAAMGLWLDGIRNTKGAPNENLSREFMELFTLGHANGYTEADVREGARALTGRHITTGTETGVAPEYHDSSDKTVLGVTGNLDDGGFCDVVLGQPTSAPFIAGKLWRLLASDAAPSPETVDRLVTAYGPGRDLKALTKAVLLDPEFTTSTGTVVNTPIEWLMGIVRTLSVPIDDPDILVEVDEVLAVMGQRPFYPPDVGGWPRGAVWLSTASTLARVWAANRLVSLGDLTSVTNAKITSRIDAVGYLVGVGEWSARSHAALKPLSEDPRRLVAAAFNTPEYLVS
ncbi:DUF1800 domain-containing protein [Mycolicibacterium sp.]|uniref:DUF1800 domain-containing protein n=1 Tax=Mycolicibacterium sp. TaxID=2320850 RepID=UPI001A327474|nr:DUF1800 domain-containing protein [Mycolicibacterium sp.]MBJ7336296.1 DUF1800 domain-containing protein [Mycolicibacterium sp.]